MPYILEFTRPVTITDAEQYINDCCIGGDVIVDALRAFVENELARVGATNIGPESE